MNYTFENPCPGQANGLSAYYFTQAVQMLLATHCTLGNPQDYPQDIGKSFTNNHQFDFIIIGGGSSGSVIANRLSEIKTWNVLLIESGGDPTFESEIPNFGLSLPGRELDWNFETNQTGDSCLGMEDETCRVFQGKVLGGTSTINRMHYLRGTPDDYDEWQQLGNTNWGYERVVGYFKKSEKLDEDFEIVSDDTYDGVIEKGMKMGDEFSKIAVGKFHSKSGLLSVNHFAYNYFMSEVRKAIFTAGEEIGVRHIGDVNRKGEVGFFRVWGTIHEGNRGNTAKAFLTPAKQRQNLFVMKNTTVERLVFKKGRITGVVFNKNGETTTLTARKEVILTAGPINSPRLLMLSGIGPQHHLEKIGLKVVKNLPGVGKNLQFHLTFFGLPVALKTETKSVSHLQKIDAMYQFISRGTGFFGSVGINDVMAFISTKNQSVPDVGILLYLNHARDYYTFNELLISVKIKNQIRDQLAKASAKSAVLLIAPTLLKPNSRGRVELSGPDFRNPPKIHPNFLTDKKDVETLIRGIQFGVKLTQTKAFQKFEPEILKLEIEGCRDWECSIRHLATSMHDAAGTCKMGPKGDSDAVVDDRLRVYGVEGLRIADSSIMPRIVKGSVSVAEVMIGEMVSDFIKEDWRKKKKKDEL